MHLYIAAAIGQARTELAAFDRALTKAGVANFNLIRLSSVIPPGSHVVETDRCPPTPDGGWGDRLYVVYAEQRTSRPGAQVWAGVGWVQDPGTGAGLFVEHEGDAETTVRDQITASLEDLQESRGTDVGPIRMRIVGATCVDIPTCALVICRYASECWPEPKVLSARHRLRRSEVNTGELHASDADDGTMFSRAWRRKPMKLSGIV